MMAILVVPKESFQAGKRLGLQFSHDLLGADPIVHIRRCHHHSQNQAQGIDSQVALATLDLFGPIIAVLAAHLRRFHGLTVHTGRTGSWFTHLLGISDRGRALPDLLAQGIHELLKQTVVTPFGEIIIDGTFRQQVVR